MTDKIVSYKDKNYRLIWSGKIKSGALRARLQFLNGSKDFWVDEALIGSKVPTKRAAPRKGWYGWDGVVGSDSYYSSGAYDEMS